jgi:hypothetical protein
MTAKPRAVVLLEDLHTQWLTDEKFLATEEILRRLKAYNPSFWTKDGDENPYEKDLSAKGLRNMIYGAIKLTPRPELYADIAPVQPSRGAQRGYFRKAFDPLWDRLGIDKQVGDPRRQPDQPVHLDKPDAPDVSDAEETRDCAPDTPDTPDAPDEPDTPDTSGESAGWCWDCGTEFTGSDGTYCQECFDQREPEKTSS